LRIDFFFKKKIIIKSGKDEQSTKVEEEKLMWFLEQIQGDASFGGSSYQFDEEELEQIQHSNTETFETEKEKLMKEREQERREKERILKEKNEEKKGLKNKLKIRRRKKQPSTQEPKPKQPTPKIEKVLSKKFKKFQKPSSHSSPFPPICEKDDLETNQMLQENARKKQEAAIQEKLQLLMSSQGESSTYQFEENEKVLLDQKDLEKRTIDQAQKVSSIIHFFRKRNFKFMFLLLNNFLEFGNISTIRRITLSTKT